MHEFLEKTAADVMTVPCKFVSTDMTLGELHRRFELDALEAYPVVCDGVVLGIISKFEALRPFAFSTACLLPHYAEIMGARVGQIMSRDVPCVRPDTRLTHVLQTMVQHRAESLPVVEADGRLVGVVGREDIFQALRASTFGAETTTVDPDEVACRLTG